MLASIYLCLYLHAHSSTKWQYYYFTNGLLHHPYFFFFTEFRQKLVLLVFIRIFLKNLFDFFFKLPLENLFDFF